MNDARRRTRSAPMHRSDADVAEAAARLVRAIGRRVSDGDVDSIALLVGLNDAIGEAWSTAVAGWRATGITDGEIGRELGITKQAVAQRWPRPKPLAPDQLDGLACVDCGARGGAMVPAGEGPAGQLFRHEVPCGAPAAPLG